MAAAYQVVTFDCYGTLIDWEAGIFEAFAAEAAGDGVALEREAVLAAYAEVEPAIQREAFRPYRDVLQRTAIQVASRFGWVIGPDRARFLAQSLPDWPVFQDTNRALRRMKAAGLELGILSNVDDDLLAATCRRFDVPFDFLVTAEQVRAYKPARAHFAVAAARLSGRSWVHVAQSLFHDVVPGHEAGLPVLWVDRHGEAAANEARPVAVVRDLAEAAAWLLD